MEKQSEILEKQIKELRAKKAQLRRKETKAEKERLGAVVRAAKISEQDLKELIRYFEVCKDKGYSMKVITDYVVKNVQVKSSENAQ